MSQTRPGTELPTGTVTFLLTDVEGSTKLWEGHPEEMKVAMARHHTIAQELSEIHSGFRPRDQGEGDSLVLVFAGAVDAVKCALRFQLALHKEPWPEHTPLRVRMALHTGEAELADATNYAGTTIIRCARLRAIAHGGQILLSQATRDLVQDRLPSGASLKEMGSHVLKDLSRPEQVYQLSHPDLPGQFPALRSLSALPHNLPIQLTSFIGREEEMSRIRQLVSQNRIVTLTGAGGAGKTRLALQVAADLIEQFPDGAWLVDFSALTDPEFVTQTTTIALGVRDEAPTAPTDTPRESRPSDEVLSDYLRARRILLIFDNCEHLISSCARLADLLLHSCPELKILVTSREPLGIAGEATHRVPSLAVPQETELSFDDLPAYEAVRLFVDRALLARDDFRLTQREAPAVAQIVRRLDGIPLALELAAARVKVLSCTQIASRLDDRFRLLTGGSRTALPRQHTLQALVDWSHDLLSEPEQTLFRRLSAFAGSFTLEAVEDVCSGGSVGREDVLDLLSALVDKSLVLTEQQGEEPQYRLLETMRQYAREKLLASGEVEDLRRRHRDFYLGFANTHGLVLFEGGDAKRALDALETALDNLRLALEWSLGESDDGGLRLVAVLLYFWYWKGHVTEGRRWFRDILAASSEAPTLSRAGALAAASTLGAVSWDIPETRRLAGESLSISKKLPDRSELRWFATSPLIDLSEVARADGDVERAKALAEEALKSGESMDDTGSIAHAHWVLAELAGQRQDYEEARRRFETSIDISRSAGLELDTMFYLANLGHLVLTRGRYDEARGYFEECLETARRIGLLYWLGMILALLAVVARAQKDQSAGRAFSEEALGVSRQSGERRSVARILLSLGQLAFVEGDFDQARTSFNESLQIFRELNERGLLTIALNAIAYLEMATREFEPASRHLEEALRIAREDDIRLMEGHLLHGLGEALEGQGDLAAARKLFDESLEALEASGTPEGTALPLTSLGDVALAENDFEIAGRHHREALQIRAKRGNPKEISENLHGLASVASGLGNFERAARLFGASDRYRPPSGVWISNIRPTATRSYPDTIEKLRKALGAEAFEAEWEKGRKLSIEEAVAHALSQD